MGIRTGTHPQKDRRDGQAYPPPIPNHHPGVPVSHADTQNGWTVCAENGPGADHPAGSTPSSTPNGAHLMSLRSQTRTSSAAEILQHYRPVRHREPLELAAAYPVP